MKQLTGSQLPFRFYSIPPHLQKTARAYWKVARSKLFLNPRDPISPLMLRGRQRDYMKIPELDRLEWELYLSARITQETQPTVNDLRKYLLEGPWQSTEVTGELRPK
jgi:hypothetical protein